MDVSNDPTPHETNNGNKNNTDMVEVTPDEIDETNSLETANDPENNVIRDIKRKVVIALFLMIPNVAVLGKLSCYPC